MAPFRLELTFKVTDVLWSEGEAKETTPVARQPDTGFPASTRQASLRSGTRIIISRTPSYRWPLWETVMEKWLRSDFCTSFTAVMNFGKSSIRSHCR